MPKTSDDLALRKQVLQAKSSLQRLEIQRDLQGIADSLGWLRTGVDVLGTVSKQAGRVGLVLRSLVGNPVGTAAALGSGMFVLSKVVNLVLRLLRPADADAPRKNAP